MKSETVNVSATVAGTTGSAFVATNPHMVAFYQTDAWLGSIAIIAALGVAVGTINAIWLLCKNIKKWRSSDD